MGGLGDVVTAVRETAADTVAILSCPEVNSAQLRRLAWALEKTSTDLCLAPALLDVAGPRTTVRAVAGLPLLYMDHPDLSGLRQVIKGAFDRAAAGAALLLVAPLLLVIAAVVRLEDGGPSLTREMRVGRDSKPFGLYRFRTLARETPPQPTSLDGPGDGGLFNIRDEPRVTKAGVRLRRWSMDRLPQLVNVLFGQMSLVGPRPALPDEVVLYGEYVRRRLAVRPGVTGLLQLRGKNTLSWDERVRLDLRYVENWSFVLDLQILWKTCAAVVRGSGAY
jgi:lipopolysaccharide/colanic/teichoic acid biosynthesis glycosyltransferase